MNEWTIFLALTTVVSFIFTVTKPIIGLNASIVELTIAVGASKTEREQIRTHNDEQDKRINEHEKILADHEARIRRNENDLKMIESKTPKSAGKT